MRKFYLDIIYRMFMSLREAVYAVEAFAGVSLFVLLLANKSLAAAVEGWEGVNPRWAIAPLAVVFTHLFLKAIYEKYHELESRLPKLSGNIDMTVSGNDATFGEVLIILISIRNLGPPTAVEKYSVIVTTGENIEATGKLCQHLEMKIYSGGAPTSVIVPGAAMTEPPKRTILPSDYIYNKTVEPIASGSLVRGYLMVNFSGLGRGVIAMPDLKVAVKFSDIVGTEYVANFLQKAEHQGPWQGFPGVSSSN